MNPRRLAGSRRNKHLPIARRTVLSDRTVARCEEVSVRWLAARDGMGHAIAAMFHNPAQGSKPDHAARAVDIHTIWPPLELDRTKAVRQVAAEAGARGRSAEPMGRGDRLDAYRRQNGRTTLTTRQWRQLDRMQLRAALTAAP